MCVCDECVWETVYSVCVCDECVWETVYSVHVNECHYAMASLLAPILYCCSMTTGHAYLNVGLDDLPEITFSETFLVLGAPQETSACIYIGNTGYKTTRKLYLLSHGLCDVNDARCNQL